MRLNAKLSGDSEIVIDQKLSGDSETFIDRNSGVKVSK